MSLVFKITVCLSISLFLMSCAESGTKENTSEDLKTLETETICGRRDDRRASSYPEMGRLIAGGWCSGTLVSNSCFVTAGHCFRSSKNGVVEFEVPRSQRRRPVRASAKNTYRIDASSVVKRDAGKGKDYAVLKLRKNELSGLYPGEAQGYLDILWDAPKKGWSVRISGYGKDKYNSTGNYAQQTNVGSLSYVSGSKIWHRVDTMGANSGSSIVDVHTGKIVGVHTHGGCGRRSGYNYGTAIATNEEFRSAVLACIASESSGDED